MGHASALALCPGWAMLRLDLYYAGCAVKRCIVAHMEAPLPGDSPARGGQRAALAAPPCRPTCAPYLCQALAVGGCQSPGSASYLMRRMLAPHPRRPGRACPQAGGVSLPPLTPSSSL